MEEEEEEEEEEGEEEEEEEVVVVPRAATIWTSSRTQWCVRALPPYRPLMCTSVAFLRISARPHQSHPLAHHTAAHPHAPSMSAPALRSCDPCCLYLSCSMA